MLARRFLADLFAHQLRTELPTRLSHRLRDLQELPYIVASNPRMAHVYDLYLEAFEKSVGTLFIPFRLGADLSLFRAGSDGFLPLRIWRTMIASARSCRTPSTSIAS